MKPLTSKQIENALNLSNAFLDPTGVEAKILCEAYDGLASNLSPAQLRQVERIGYQIEGQLPSELNVMELRSRLLHEARVLASLTEVAAILFVNYPLPLQVAEARQ